MSAEEILLTLHKLARANGSYSKVYKYALDNSNFLDNLESLNFKDEVDLILYLED